MLSVASARSKERVRTEPKSSAIITAPGEKCGLAGRVGRMLRILLLDVNRTLANLGSAH